MSWFAWDTLPRLRIKSLEVTGGSLALRMPAGGALPRHQKRLHSVCAVSGTRQHLLGNSTAHCLLRRLC